MRIRELNRKLPLALLLVGALAGSVGSTGCKQSTRDDSGGLPRSETLYVAGRQWGEPVSFNPLLSNPAWPVSGGLNLMYEFVLLFNPLTGKMEPMLAESYRQSDRSIEVTLNAAARWSDGKPVTGWDIKYSFDLARTYKSLPGAPFWAYLKEVRLLDASGGALPDTPAETPDYPRRVEFVFDQDRLNPLMVLDALAEMRIVPRHVVEPELKRAGSIDEYTKLKLDKDPVISGPYQLKLYSSEKIVLERRPDYWGNAALFGGKQPVPKYVVHPIYKSNDHFSVALQQGRLDMSSTFVPRIWLKNKKGVQSWFDDAPYFQATGMPMLFLNVKHGALADVAYRRAMAFAINYTDVRELAMSGYSEPLQPGLILPFGLESKYYSAEDAKQFGATYDPARAKALLQEAGYRPVFDEKGELVETRKNGARVPTVYIKSPTGWGDWESIVRIAVRGMRAVGIDARERFVDGNLFWNALFQGDFDLIMNTPASPPSPSKPWSRFDVIMTTADFAAEGEKVYKNMGRFNDPKAPGYLARIDQLLTQIPTLKDEAELTKAYRELNVIFMQQQPTIPLVYRPDQFYEFSTRHWQNYATGKNPYLPPQVPGERLGTRMLWSLKPVAQN
jgi:peptide/nickel transport system substrate-binding protein